MKHSTVDGLLGIWIDYSFANLFEFSLIGEPSTSLISKLVRKEEEPNTLANRNELHYAKKNLQNAFYEQLLEKIIAYDRVVLFGDSEAKIDFFQLLSSNRHYDRIIVELKHVDSLTEFQQQEFVSAFFLRSVYR